MDRDSQLARPCRSITYIGLRTARLDKAWPAITLTRRLARDAAVHIILLSAAACLLAWILTGLYTRTMVSLGRLEHPNERGMHTVPVPSGAGIAIMASALAFWCASPSTPLASGYATFITACIALTAISWIDDRRGLSPALRLAVQAAAVAVLLGSLGADQRVAPALPLVVERMLLGLAWLWFINLFNFMDGLDGLAGSEAIGVAAGYVLVAAAIGSIGPLGDFSLLIAAACAGYLVWNWHPAKVFMGDSGAIPLGFVLGWMMIHLALQGQWAATGILPLYFAADATITLAKRLWRGRKPWDPHREHFYQRAVLGGAAPQAVVCLVTAANIILVALSLLSVRYPLLALAAAALIVTGLLGKLERFARARHR